MKKVITIIAAATMISCNGQRNFSKTVEQENQMTEQKVEPVMLPGDTILEFAQRRGTPEIVKMLRERGAKK